MKISGHETTHEAWCLASLAYVRSISDAGGCWWFKLPFRHATPLTTCQQQLNSCMVLNYLGTPHNNSLQLRIDFVTRLEHNGRSTTTNSDNPLSSSAPFYKEFTAEKIAKIEELHNARSGAESKAKYDLSTSLPIRLLNLPPELRCLQPPEPPADGLYRCFGIDHSSQEKELMSLEQIGITQLYTPPSSPSPGAPSTSKTQHHDRAFILKRLAKSILLNFLELVGIMSIEPSQYGEKIEDLKTLAINFHHLLNEYRPHQARESLILMMQDQLERSKAETEGILRMKGEVEGLLEGLGSAGLAEREVAEKDVMRGRVDEEGRDVWEEIWKTFA
ncbi:Mediator of RNA polymerase II transcription subunit 7 [Hyphodiscus hymeniophilus]|uniref:Mediator of RNA polymerase II transcription subunit 7 n=1 Tax=Hyphodiscus hymeniophilus TaxID=353542 RepID=A0A9P6SN60_9HELO|nr:Mediator of RNA polymerase II transcription subunit 7 [Hyphodiscus hymeniophilus]